jgi:nucleoid DNA-binding protein
MIKVDIVNEVSRVAEITKVKAELAVDAVFEAMRHSMQRGERIELRGFGVFQVKPRKRAIEAPRPVEVPLADDEAAAQAAGLSDDDPAGGEEPPE